MIFTNKLSFHVLRADIFVYIVGRMFASGLGDWGSILGRVIPKTQNMVLDASLLNTQHCKI